MNVIPIVRQSFRLLAGCALAVGLVAAANAQTLLVDFGNNAGQYRGVPVVGADDNGNYWNSIQPGLFVENMVDVGNTATAIDLGWDTPVGTDSYNGPSGGPTDVATLETDVQFVDVDAAALGNLGGSKAGVFDYANGPAVAEPGSGRAARFQLQELDPTKRYTLTFFGSHMFSMDTTTVYTVYTDSSYSTPVASASLDVQDAAMPWLYNRDKVATIANLAPQTDNILYVEFVGTTGREGFLNAMQIEAAAAPGIVGDYNGDQQVDAADYTVWRDHLGQTFDLPNRDPANTGAISNADYLSWKSHFSSGGSGSLAAGAVPEPGTIVFCMLASVGAACLRNRRR